MIEPKRFVLLTNRLDVLDKKTPTPTHHTLNHPLIENQWPENADRGSFHNISPPNIKTIVVH